MCYHSVCSCRIISTTTVLFPFYGCICAAASLNLQRQISFSSCFYYTRNQISRIHVNYICSCKTTAKFKSLLAVITPPSQLMSVCSGRDKLLLVQMSTSISGLQTLAAHIVSWRLDWYSSIHNRRLQDKIQVCCSWMLHKRIYSNINVLYVCIQLPAVTRGMLIGWIAPGLFMFFVDWNMMMKNTQNIQFFLN